MFPWKLTVLSGPSGAGKTTCIRTMLKQRPDVDFCLLPSVTTRAPRPNDEPWYKYVSLEEFREMKREFLWVEYMHGNFYGTTTEDLVRSLAYGDCLVASLTPHDLRTIARYARKYGVPVEKMLFLHICSPGEAILRERLLARGDNPESIDRRVRDCATWDDDVRKLEKPGILTSWDIALPITYLTNDSTKEAFEEQISALFT